jgi:Zn-dependent protease
MQREPFGTLLVPLISFFLFSTQGGRWMIGWASAPYDPNWEDRHPQRAALMAAAGPAANLALSLIGWLALKVGLLMGLWATPHYFPRGLPPFDQVVVAAAESGSAWIGVGRFCSVLFSLNLILFLFNLLPLPPMDGASVLSGLVPAARQLRERIGANPMLGLIGLVLAWRVFPYLLSPIYRAVLHGLY